MGALSDGIGPQEQPKPQSDQQPGPATTSPTQPDEQQQTPAYPPFRPPYLRGFFQKGNKYGCVSHPQKRRAKLEKMCREASLNGETIVTFWRALALGQPFPMKHVQRLPMSDLQLKVAQGSATKEEKKAAKRHRRFIVVKVPYYPTVEDMKEANNWLSDRGWGKAPQTVVIEGDGETQGFSIVHRRWPIGVDPLGEVSRADDEQVIDGKARVIDENGNGNGQKRLGA